MSYISDPLPDPDAQAQDTEVSASAVLVISGAHVDQNIYERAREEVLHLMEEDCFVNWKMSLSKQK